MENPIKMDDLGVPPFKETPNIKPGTFWSHLVNVQPLQPADAVFVRPVPREEMEGVGRRSVPTGRGQGLDHRGPERSSFISEL